MTPHTGYPTSGVTFVDDFCGAGGSSQGLKEAGFNLVQAANHSDKALETHAANFPDADHLQTDLLVYDPRRRPRADVYWASPSCTWHSPAGGRKRARAMLDLFDDYVPNSVGERSRLTMMTVVSMSEAKRFPIVIVENVVEVADWELFPAWLQSMELLGYERQILCVSAAHVWSGGNRPAPQWRDRVYFVFSQRGIPFPDVSPRPWAACTECGVDVRSVQSWKKPGQRIGKYGPQYVYVCPVPGHPRVEPYVMPALDALDLTDLGDRIADKPLRTFTDKKTGETYQSPLARASLRRVRVGALMFGGEPEIIANTGHTYDATNPRHPQHGDPSAYHRVWPASDPLKARSSGPGDAFVTALNHSGAEDGRAFSPGEAPFPTRSTKLGDAVVTPFMLQRRDYDVPDGSRVTGVDRPMPTRTASDRGIHALVTQPYLTEYYGNGSAQATDEPIGTVTTREHHALVSPCQFIDVARTNSTPTSPDLPLATVTTGRHHSLVTPFLSRQYSSRGKNVGHLNTSVHEPMHPITATGGNHALVTPTRRPKLTATSEQVDAVDVSEFRFRMLRWREHATAQRFPRDYVFTGNSSENTLMAGNAVASNVAHYLGLLARVALGDAAASALGLDWLEVAA